MKRLVLAFVASTFAVGIAIAQQPAPMPGMDMKPSMDMKMMGFLPKEPAREGKVPGHSGGGLGALFQTGSDGAAHIAERHGIRPAPLYP